jgi:hypothetical protein
MRSIAWKIIRALERLYPPAPTGKAKPWTYEWGATVSTIVLDESNRW